MFDYTADNLLQAIRDLAYVGNSAREWDDPKLLRLINRQVGEYMLPLILRARKEHFVTYTDQALVANQAAYFIPSKATAEKIRAVQLVDANGNPYSDLAEIPLEVAVTIGQNAVTGPVPSGLPQNYYFRGNQLVLVPAPASSIPSLSLRIFFAARPSTLVLKATCVQITNLTGGGGAAGGHFRVGIGATVPSGYVATAVCDLVQNVPGFDVLFSGAISAIVAGTYVDFVGTLPAQLAVGDWLCLSDTAPVITGGIPEVVIGCLTHKCILEAMSKKAEDLEFRRRQSLLKGAEKDAEQLLKARRNQGDHAKAGSGSLYRFRRGGWWS